jgi:hypothetical protein
MLSGASIGNKWKYFAAATEFTTAGHYLDAYFKTDPLLTIVMLVGGFITGTVYLIKILKEPQNTP